jgi:ABC-type Fe3+ transport system permease subunit
MSTIVLVASLASTLWLFEMLMLAKEDWTVSRKTPMSNFMGAKGNTFCSIFWGTSLLYFFGFILVGVACEFLVYFGIGIIELINGIATHNSSFVMVFIAAVIFALSFAVICWLVAKSYGKIKKVANDRPALFKLYHAIKEAYCPILK